MLNNFILQKVYHQVMYVNPFNSVFEIGLHNEFENRYNNEKSVIQRHWEQEANMPQQAFIYFADCKVVHKRSASKAVFNSYSEWFEVDDADVFRYREQGFQVHTFFKPLKWFANQFDVDMNFLPSKITECFDNISQHPYKANMWHVVDEFDNVQHVIDSKKADGLATWTIMQNVGVTNAKKERYQFNLPINSMRHFRDRILDCGVILNWKKGIMLNTPNLSYAQRNDPKLLHIVDTIDNGIIIANNRAGINTVYFNDKVKFIVDRNEKIIIVDGLTVREELKPILSKLYELLVKAGKDFGNGMNLLREDFNSLDNITILESKLMNDLIFSLQRKITIR